MLLNLSFIGCALLLTPHLHEPIWALAVAVILGGLAQLALQAWALAQRGLLAEVPAMLRRPFKSLSDTWRDERVRRILTLMLPASLAVSVAQVSLVINTHIASRLAEGSVSWLSFADRLMEFPTALLGVALGTVLLPSLTKAHNLNDPARVSQLIDWGLRLVVLLALPAAVGLALLAPGLTAGLFHYGAFDSEDLSMTAYAMQGYAIGLLGLIAVKVLAPGFYAQQDIKTPVKIALATLVLTQLLNLGLVPLMGHAGLAVATSLAACFNAGLLLVRLRQRGTYRPEPGWVKLLLKCLVAALVMAGGLIWLTQPIDWGAEQARPFVRLGMLFGLIALAVISYFAVLRLLGMPLRSMMRPPSVD